MKFDILQKETPILGHRVIEASAGTGKTFTIEHLVLRLLTLEEGPLSLEQILVVTFTKAAAREIKIRIRSHLTKAAASSPHLQEALQSYERAHIFTIHGFCLKMLREFAFESGLMFGAPHDPQQVAGKSLQFIQKFLRSLDPRLYHPVEIACLWKKYNGVDKLTETLLQVIEKEPVIQKKESFYASFSTLQSTIAKYQPLFTCEESLLLKDFAELFPHYKVSDFKEADFQQQVHLLSRLPQIQEEDFAALIHCELSVIAFLDPSNRKKGDRKSYLHYPDFFAAVREHIYPIIQRACSVPNILLRLAFDLKERLQIWYEEEGILTPDAIVQRMQKSCGQAPFTDQIKKKFRAVIIDEFQDTDPVQWDIFQTLFLTPPAIDIFYVVGDPKQSIYGFRKADIYTYLQASAFIGPQNLFYLDTNYRSVPSLVDSLNAFFGQKPWLYLPQKNSFLNYMPVKAGLPAQEKGSPLHVFIAQGKKYSAEMEELLFLFIAKEVLILQKEGLAFSEIAILVKDRYQAKALQDYLQSCHIPCSVKSHALITETVAFHAFKECFQAILDPRNTGKIKAALCTPFFGWTLAQLDDEVHPSLISQFYTLKKILQKEGLPAFFSAFFQTVLDKNSSFLQDALQVMEYLLQCGQKRALGWENLEEFLDELEIAPEENLRKPSFVAEEGVQIMTIHASKGLEFTAVFALGLAAESQAKADSFLSSEAQKMQIQEQEAEKLRQLYVAMTRAKKHMYVPLFLGEEIKEKTSPIQLFFTYQKDPTLSFPASTLAFLDKLAKDQKLTYAFLQQGEKPQFQKITKDIHIQAPPVLFGYANQSKIYSFSSLVKKEERAAPLPASSGLPRGPEFGAFIHYLLEKIIMQPITKDHVQNVLQKEIPLSHFEPFAQEIAALVEKALYTDLDKFSLADVSSDHILTEVEFLYPIELKKEEHWLKGFIDLLFFHQGKYYLLDWKTNDLHDYSSSALNEVIKRENYFLQASIYTQALRKFLHLVDPKPFEEIFGGMFYVFLRGSSVYHFIPDPEVATYL